MTVKTKVKVTNETKIRVSFPGVVVVDLRGLKQALSDARQHTLVLQTNLTQLSRLRL